MFPLHEEEPTEEATATGKLIGGLQKQITDLQKQLEELRGFYQEREATFIKEWNLLSGALDKMFIGLKMAAVILINSTNPYDFEVRSKEFITLLETFHSEIKKASEKKGDNFGRLGRTQEESGSPSE